MKRTWLALALAVASQALAAAAPPPPGDRWWRDRTLLPALGLDAAAQRSLEQIYVEASAQLERLAAEQAAAETAFAERIHQSATEPTLAAVDPLLQRVTAARVAVERRHVQMLLELRAGMGTDAFSTLQRLQSAEARPAPPGAPGPPASGGASGPRERGDPPRPEVPRPVGDPPGQPTSPGPAGPPLPRHVALPLPPGSWWRDPGQQQSLGLTPQQVGALEVAFTERRDALGEQGATLAAAEAAASRHFRPGPLDLQTAVAAAAGTAEARGALERLFLELQWAQWRLLQPEQRLALSYGNR